MVGGQNLDWKSFRFIFLLFLSLGWSMGSFFIGRAMHCVGRKGATIMGTLLMVFGNCMALFFSGSTSMIQCVLSFLLIGTGMGLVTLSTLLIVQDSLNPENLGVATSFHQFSRSLGGTIGVGVCGGFATTSIIHRIKTSGNHLSDEIFVRLKENMAILFQEEFYTLFPEATISFLRNVLLDSLFSVFIMVFSISLLCLILAFFLPSQTSIKK